MWVRFHILSTGRGGKREVRGGGGKGRKEGGRRGKGEGRGGGDG